MATIENRSSYTVSVKNRDDLHREFPFYKPYLTQKENAFLIKITQAGYKPVRYTCQSLQAAEDAISRIEAERRTGLFIDYTKAHQVTFEGLLRRYIKEEGPKNKGSEKSEKYKCLGWLENLNGGAEKRVAQIKAKATNVGAKNPKHHSMRQPAETILWMRKSA